MRATPRRRLDKLEHATAPPGRIIVIGCRQYDWTPAHLAEAARLAELAAGPNDTIVRVQYVKSWKAENEAH